MICSNEVKAFSTIENTIFKRFQEIISIKVKIYHVFRSQRRKRGGGGFGPPNDPRSLFRYVALINMYFSKSFRIVKHEFSRGKLSSPVKLASNKGKI